LPTVTTAGIGLAQRARTLMLDRASAMMLRKLKALYELQ
jgi:hypothetical protein